MAPSKKPTDSAKMFFDRAFEEALRARHALDMTYTADPQSRALFEICQAVGSLARGLTELSTGLRATYMAVEQLGGGSAGGGQPPTGVNFIDQLVKDMQKQQAKAVQDAVTKAIRALVDAGGNLANITGVRRP